MNIINMLQKLFVLYGLDILIVLIACVIIFLIGRYISPKLSFKILKHLVVEAEKHLGSKTGQLKMAWVWQQLPLVVKFFLSQ